MKEHGIKKNFEEKLSQARRVARKIFDKINSNDSLQEVTTIEVSNTSFAIILI